MRRTLILAALLLLTASTAQAKTLERTLCVYDPSGAVGDAYNLMKEYQSAALGWGVNFQLKPYTDEKTASEDLKAGKCHAALLTGVRGRAFVKFSGTVEAMGAINDYATLKTVLDLLANPKVDKLHTDGSYESVAIFPAGAVYLYVRDKKWNSVKDLAGKRIATMDFDKAAMAMVDRAGATIVPADIGTFAGMFNNGSVDACYAPATAFRPLELQKGLGSGGGLIRSLPTAQLTVQVLARADADLPADFGQSSRKWSAKNFHRMLDVIKRAEKDIPSHYWIEVPAGKLPQYEELFRQMRIKLKGSEYDGTMLALLRRVRCKGKPGRAECAEKKE